MINRVINMKCKNCGEKMEKGDLFCPSCGMSKKYGSDNSNALIIILSAAAIIVALAVIFISLKYGMNSDDKTSLLKSLSKTTDKEIIEFYYDDFNNDSVCEAFAVAGEGSKDSFTTAEIWYVTSAENTVILENINGAINGILEENGSKYISVEISEGEKSSSYIYGVNQDGGYSEPPASRKYQNVHQSDGKILTIDNKEITLLNESQSETTALSFHESKASVSTTAGKVKKTTKTTTKTTAKSADKYPDWRIAYKDYLKDSFQKDKSSVVYGNDSKLLFGYIDNNDVPELMISSGSAHTSYVVILTYYNGKVYNLGSYKGWGTITYYEKKGYFKSFFDKNRGAGFEEGFYSIKNGAINDSWFGTSEFSQTGDSAKYFVNGSEVSEESYNNQKKSYTDKFQNYASSEISTGYGGHSFTLENVKKLETLSIEKNISDN